MLLGSENPLSLDGMNWTPKVPQIEILHAINDHVIAIHELEEVSHLWECSMTSLPSKFCFCFVIS